MNPLFKPALLALLFALLALPSFSQGQFAFTQANDQRRHDQFLRDSLINYCLQAPLSPSTEKEWLKAFWAMELMLYKSEYTQQKLHEAWQHTDQLSEGFLKSLLEVSYTLYPGAFTGPVTQLLQSTSSPAVFIRAAEYLRLTDQKQHLNRLIRKLIAQKFRGSNFLGLTLLQQRLGHSSQKRPSLRALFDSTFLPGQTIIYSLHRSNRNYPGLVLIRKPNGQFARNADGNLFYTTQLARAITNYPFYVTNGNTPQGLFRWTGFDSSANKYIGPTTNLQLVMPYEAPPAIFFSNNSVVEKEWSEALYTALLPPAWKQYKGIYESLWAGAMGRSEIIMHGTTINPLYYKGQPYFPHTPSLGCLCSYEEWDANGGLTLSNQTQIVNTLQTIGSSNGYVVVVDLDDQKKAVQLREVEDSLN